MEGFRSASGSLPMTMSRAWFAFGGGTKFCGVLSATGIIRLAARPRHRRMAQGGVTRWGALFMTARTVRMASGLSGKSGRQNLSASAGPIISKSENDMGKKSGKNRQPGDSAAGGFESSSIHTLRRLYRSSQRHVQSERHVREPWYVVRSDHKRRARLNLIRHLLSLIPYKDIPQEKVKLPKRHLLSSKPQNDNPFRFIPGLY